VSAYKPQDYKGAKPTWCPGCGDFAVLASIQGALSQLGIPPERVVVASGIGCSGKISQHLSTYGFHGLHGRSIPLAQGIKLTNPELTVLAAGGDGDGYGIGLSHSLHAMRRNVDITYIVMDNNIYGLTTGQLSPTSQKGFKSKTSPQGSHEEPIRPLEMAIATGASFVAQAFSGDPAQMTRIIKEAIMHKGFSLVNVFSPCVTFNQVNTYDWFKANRIDLEKEEGYDPTDRWGNLRRVAEAPGMVTGIIYREERPIFPAASVRLRAEEPLTPPMPLAAPQQEALLGIFS
jgi:2-oxoglutarate ferredoxin oxidoreductase subunit beta